MTTSLGHISVISDDMVIVMVTSHEKKNIEGSRRIILYNMCKYMLILRLPHGGLG